MEEYSTELPETDEARRQVELRTGYAVTNVQRILADKESGQTP